MPTGQHYAQETALSSAKPLPEIATARANATADGGKRIALALVSPEAQAVRWRDDGVSPTATVGMPLAVGAFLEWDGDLDAIQFFEQTAGAVLNVIYYSSPR